jgi:membrane protease YdiL (CAAX protease family)
MIANETRATWKSERGQLIALAWASTLLASMLPDILLKELTGSLPPWLYGAKVGLAVALWLATLLWKRLRPLWLFGAVLVSVYLLDRVVGQFFAPEGTASWLAGTTSFVQNVGYTVIPRLAVALLLVVVMRVLTGSFARFFLTKGKLDAQAAPIPLIMSRPSTWRVLGPAIGGAMSLGLVVFIVAAGGRPSPASLAGVVPLLPVVLLFALANSFGEEMIYRAPWLAALEGPAGPVQALLMTSVYFGLAHFYGVPYGIVGVVMAFIPGWLMGKSMLETRGFTWAWFIHFCMDVVVFFFMALGAVSPGG